MTLVPRPPSTNLPAGQLTSSAHSNDAPLTVAGSNVSSGMDVSDPLGLLAKSSHIAAAAAAADAVNNERKRRIAHKTDDQRREERLASNRKSAAESRKRKKGLLEELKSSLTHLSEENRELTRDNNDLRRMLEMKEKKRATDDRRKLRLQLELEYLSKQQQQQLATFRLGNAGVPDGAISAAAMPFNGPDIVRSIARVGNLPPLRRGSCGGTAGQRVLFYCAGPEQARPVTSTVRISEKNENMGRLHPAGNSFFS